MKNLCRDALTSILALLAPLATPTIERRLAKWAEHLIGDVPRLSAPWVVRFRWPMDRGGSRSDVLDVVLYQFGRQVHGYGHVQGEPGDRFEYRGAIKRNVFFGTFRRADGRMLSGTGSFVLKIAADSKTMQGRCGWYDSGLDDVWSSPYEWRRR